MEDSMQSRNRHGDPWRDAPLWARDLAEMVFAVMMQNEDMLALLRKEVSNLSDEDRAAMKSIIEESAKVRRLLDAATKS
jgi:3-dehydroquinate synthetase